MQPLWPGEEGKISEGIAQVVEPQVMPKISM